MKEKLGHSIHPFRIGSHLLGGMAVFLKMSIIISINNGKKLSTKHVFEDIVTDDENMVSFEKAKKSAFSDKKLFIHGETEPGKSCWSNRFIPLVQETGILLWQ